MGALGSGRLVRPYSASGTDMLNLVLIDDHPIVLAGLVDILRTHEQYCVVNTGQTAEAALRLVQNMPNWTPAKMNGLPIVNPVRLPLIFAL